MIQPARSNNGFDSAFAAVEPIGGWLTREQARVLWTEVLQLHGRPRILEIGSHQGRSTIVLAKANPVARVTAIDPFVSGRRFGGLATRAVFEANVRNAGVEDTVDLRVTRSAELLRGWHEPLDLIYIDGKHDYWTVAGDLLWTQFLSDGARFLVHDSFSSIGVTLALIRHVLPSSHIRYLDRTGSLARFEIGPPSSADRLRILREMPWWARNVGIKVLLRLRLNPLARLVGHRDTADPY